MPEFITLTQKSTGRKLLVPVMAHEGELPIYSYWVVFTATILWKPAIASHGLDLKPDRPCLVSTGSLVYDWYGVR